ncbi:MAG: hypothetical protein CVV24_08690 [Ignavibacteriae bacterium HGW-Ignavibacteriae-3]|nr:MAG: hypothetical protein CVV24_08690 [Ignavibacteriae bacterium HGW-Ignavibacteriae-3]
MQKRKFILLTSLVILILFITIGVGAYYWILDQYNLPDDGSKLVKLVTQMKDYDEKDLEKYNPKSQRSVDVQHYLIKLDLNSEQKKISGDVVISMKINDLKLRAIEINFYKNMKIADLYLNGIKAKYTQSEKLLSIQRNDMNSDSAIIRIVYQGTPKSLGFGSFNFENINNQARIYTLNEPVFASTWFPCVDLPDDKALLDIHITNDSSNVSLSNGKLINVKTNGSRKTYHWKTYYPISTYLVALYSANYKSYTQKYVAINRDTLDLYYYALPEKFEDAIKDFSDHPRYLKTFEELFGAYPFPKEKYSVAEFWWQSGAMESQTVTGVGSNFITGRKFYSDMLIHELAHHWWGNAVGPKDWKDIWLNEGFATYSEALYWEKQSDIRALRSTLAGKFGTFSKGTLYNPGSSLFTRLIYNKGAWVLHMLRREIGDELFFKTLREYFRQYKYGNASTNDFRNLCEKISKKNLRDFFDQWVFKGEGIIELNASWKTEKAEGKFITTITIKQLQKGYDIYKFPLDIKLVSEKEDKSNTSSARIEGKEVTLSYETEFKPVKILLDPDSWLLAKQNIIPETEKK